MYSSIFRFLSFLVFPKLIAEDLDSPPNGQIRFSIINGDRNNEFSIDPTLGLIKVKKKLDRERVRPLHNISGFFFHVIGNIY